MRLGYLFLFISSLSYAQSWSGILSNSRAIDWSHAGLPATLPDGETTANPWTPPVRTQCGATVNPSGDQSTGTDVTNINTAIGACTAGHYVLLAPGTFYISNANNCYGGTTTCIAFFNPATGTTPRNGITVRGSGAQSTRLTFSGASLIAFSISSSTGSCSWTGGLSAGSTTLTTASCSGPSLVANQIVTLNQCDTGYSGATCATGSSVDGGGLFVCQNDLTCVNQIQGGENNQQKQVALVTSVSGNTVTIASPGIYMPNWASGSTPTISWPAFQTYGDAIEDLTVYSPLGSSSVDLIAISTSYGSWVKGVRFLGSGNNAPLGVTTSKNILVMNNYSFSDIALDAAYPPAFQTDSSSDVLLLNNIMASSVPWEGNGGNQGGVLAYNYARDTFTAYMENIVFDHHGGSAFQLYEGNQLGGILDDDTWGTRNLNTMFRNYTPGWDVPYVNASPRGIAIDAFARFDNLVGNVVGSQYITIYTGTGDNSAFRINGDGLTDTLTASSALRWGNCDSATSTCRFQSSEVPVSLSGNAVPFQNAVPGNNNIPCSFFLATYSSATCTPHSSGGTGLSWWKVCTSWTTFPTSCAASQAQPFPAAGPDVSGGAYVSGKAYDLPAKVAWQSLPIDATYQASYSISSSSWSGGTETLTFAGGVLPDPTHLMGGFQLSGANAACLPASGVSYTARSDGEVLITGSSTTTISYALTSNPSLSCTGTFKFPDVRQFDQRVYQTDSGAGSSIFGSTVLKGAIIQ